MLRVNVSVLLYVPVRSGSLAAIDCLNVIGTDSLEVGAAHVLIVPRPCSGVARANVPLTRWPVSTGSGRRRSASRHRRWRSRSRSCAAVYVLGDARRERAELRRSAQRQRQRRRHGAADASTGTSRPTTTLNVFAPTCCRWRPWPCR